MDKTQPVKNDLRKQIAAIQGDDYTSGSLLDYPYFKEHYKMIELNLSKQQARNSKKGPKTMQKIDFSRNLDEEAKLFIIIKEAKQTISEIFHKETWENYNISLK